VLVPARRAHAEEAGRVIEPPAAAPRSWLFVPGDSEHKQAKALASEADAIILDLEDSVAPAQLPAARERVAALLRDRGGTAQLWVRVNSPASGLMRQDMDAVCRHAVPDGIVLPKVSAPAEIAAAAGHMSMLDGRGRGARVMRLLVIATETPAGLLALPQYPAALGANAAVSTRLAGLTWGAEDLSAAIGARAKRDDAGEWTPTFQLARTSCLLAAAALGVAAVDGVYTDFKDGQGLARELSEARRDGFSAKLAIHPGQLAAINAAFAPTEAERAHAQRVVAAFAAVPGAGVASLDGQMLDRPHLVLAQRTLAARGGSGA
jgi:citrate lyase subunit beta / citryl-CoA lyase